MPRVVTAICAVVLLWCARATTAAEITHFEALSGLASTAGASAKTAAGSGGPFKLTFNALGRDFALELEPNARLSEMQKALGVPRGVVAYRGKIATRSDSWARIVMTSGTPMGLVWDGQTLFAIEAPFDSATSTNTAIIYRLEDLYIEPGTLQCGGVDMANAAQAFAAILADAPQVLAQQGATLNLNLGAVADYEFSQSFGANAQAALLARFNNVDGIFSSQLGVQISVPANAVEIFTTNDDPFTSTDPTALLEEVAVYRGSTPIQDAQGLTHLFTGRDLDGTTAGIAYVGSVCAQRNAFDPLGRSYGAGLSEGSHGLTIDSLIAAHEIGHNFGAPHDAEAGSPCESTPATFLMAPSINGSSTFSACSVSQMEPVINSASCLTAIGPPDVALSADAPNPTYPATAAFDYTITVSNIGVDPATGVVATMTLDAGLVIDGAVVPNGTCTIAAQDVQCDLGDLAGGTARGITLTLHTTAAGSYAIAAMSSADQDSNLANNTWNDSIVAEPSVDLGLAGTATALSVNQSKSVSVTLTNASDSPASNMALDISVGAGLRIDSATLGGAACSITASTAACELLSLGARAATTLLVGLAATAVGEQQLTVSVSSAETDLNTADNSLAVTISVAAPATTANTSSGGGSAFELLWMLLPLLLGRRAALARQRT
jgi:uncharacterized repeat protein (TIGR01451 family)